MGTIASPHPTAPKPRPWERAKVLRRQIAARWMQKRVQSRNFSIISNDCWGGMAYEELAMPYMSPFVGLFIVPDDYLRMVRDLRPTMESRLEFRDHSKHESLNRWREEIKRPYPIGVMKNDVEIQFLHYKDRDSAEAKWRRRSARITWSNLRVKLCWHDQPGIDALLREFDSLPLPSRLILVPPNIQNLTHAITLADYSTDGTQQYWRGHKYFDVAAFLESGRIRRVTPWRLIDRLLYWRY